MMIDGPADGNKGFTFRNFGGGSLMVWVAFSINGCLELVFVSSKIKSVDYILVNVLQKSLVPFSNANNRNKWILQQDNARIHVSRET